MMTIFLISCFSIRYLERDIGITEERGGRIEERKYYLTTSCRKIVSDVPYKMCTQSCVNAFTLPFNLDDAEVSRPCTDRLGVQRNLYILSSQIIDIHQVIVFDCKTHILFFGLKCQ